MIRRRHTPEQIIRALREAEVGLANGKTVGMVSREPAPGAEGTARSQEHASASARLMTEMDPDYLAALTLTIIPGTPLQGMAGKGGRRTAKPARK